VTSANSTTRQGAFSVGGTDKGVSPRERGPLPWRRR
jgi:hypothetical protein